jgi:uncharacterized membrane protein YfcA
MLRSGVVWTEMDVQLLLVTMLIGAGAGFCSGAFGAGGSALSTPLLALFGVPPTIAVASPLPATIPTAFNGARQYFRAGHVDFRIVRIGLAAGVPLAAFGAYLTRWVPGGTLVLATDVILIVLAVRMLLHVKLAEPVETDSKPGAFRIAVLVGLVGLVAGLLGNSGGFLLVPLFVNLLRMPMKRALGTSLLIASLLAIPGTIVHAYLGHINWMITLGLASTAIPFARVGAHVSLRARERSITVAYAIGLATVSTALLFAH